MLPNLPAADVPDGPDEAPMWRSRRARSATPPKFDLQAQGAFRTRRSARPDGFRTRRESLRRALRLSEGRAGAAGTRAWRFHARSAHRAHSATPKSTRRLLVRDEAMFGTGQLPKFKDDLFAPSPATRLLEYRSSTFQRLRSDTFVGHELQSFGPSLAHPHRRSAADELCARGNSRRSRSCRCASPPTRRASAPRRARRGGTRAA